MELLIIFIIIALLSSHLILSLRKLNPKHKHNLPGPRNLPFIGNLHLLLKPQPPHQALQSLAAIYGPIMRLKLGEIHTLIISSSVTAKEIMKTHDITFATRPINTSMSTISYGGKDIAFAPYGEFWRQMRRLCVMELLTAKRVRSFRSIREQEMSNLIRLITVSAEQGATIDLSGLFLQLTNNITARAAIGDKTVDQTFQASLGKLVELTSWLSIADLFPSMSFISRITGFNRKLQQCHLELDLICEKIIQEHRNKNDKLPLEEDITDVLLRIQEDGNHQIQITDDHIKAVINDLLLAGTETTATAIAWAISELIRNSSVMRKAQREVREAFGHTMTSMIAEEEVMSSDKLTYLQMVIKETLRLHPPIPLLLPRENQKSCEVMGYEIPTKTTVMVNVWAIGRDPSYWDEPLVFRPERFENSPVDFKGGHFDLIPFGAGRRICPGMLFGLATIEIALAHLLYYFDWEYLARKGEELDMSEAFGISGKRMFPLCLLPVSRIPLPDV